MKCNDTRGISYKQGDDNDINAYFSKKSSYFLDSTPQRACYMTTPGATALNVALAERKEFERVGTNFAKREKRSSPVSNTPVARSNFMLSILRMI